MTTFTLNSELNGIEIRFTEKPAAETLESLKSNGFRWHNKKKLWYAKQSPERLAIAKRITGNAEAAEPEQKSTAKAKAEKKNKFGVKVGDVFCNAWGWEQTNVDFWQVIKLKGTTQIVLKAINREYRAIAPMQGMVKPVKDSFTSHYEGEIIRKTVKGTEENPYCNMNHGLLTLTTWDSEHHETSYY